MSPSAHHMRSAATHSRWGTPHTTFSSLTRLARAHRLPAALRASEQRLLGGHTAAAASPLQANNSTTRVCFTSQPTKMPADTAPAAAAASSRPPASWRRPYSPGPLTEAEFEAYWEDGFVIKRGLLSQEDIDPCLAAIERRVEGVAQRLLAAGLISDPCADADVFTRLALLEKQFGEASVLVHKDGVLPPEFGTLWTHPHFMAINRQLLGPDVDIAGHPSWNLRAKAPRQAAANVPWHQDSAYCGRDSWDTLQVTAWVPMLDVDANNGCIQLLRGGHRAGKVVAHTGGDNAWYLNMDEAAAIAELGVDFAADLVTAEMKAGDVLLLNNHIPHRSLDNTSHKVRWSLDLRWQDAAAPEGNFGLKPAILLAKAGDPADFVIDWACWSHLDKKSGSADGLKAVDQAAGEDPELSTILIGDWIGLWPITNTNKHTDAWQAFVAAKQQQQAAN